MPIKGLKPRFSILGHIKAGGRKEITSRGKTHRIPEKWDHFVVTKSERDDLDYTPDNELMQKLVSYDKQGDGQLRKMLIFLPFDDIDENLLTTLAVYDGNGVRCRGDGESAEYLVPDSNEVKKVKCPCRMLRIGLEDRVEDREDHPFLRPDIKRGQVCKTHGLLRVMIAEAKTMGGVHVFRTTSSNSIRQLLASMAHIQELTGGQLAYVPLELSIKPKRVKPEATDGYQTVFVVDLTYSAGPLEFLNDIAKQAQLRASMRQRIASNEIAVLPAPGFEDVEEQRSVAEEYVGTGALDGDDGVIDGSAEEVTDKPKQEERPQGQQPQNAPKQSGKPPTVRDEQPPPPTDAEAPADSQGAEPKPEAAAPPSEPLKLDDKGFPVIVNAEPQGSATSPATKEIRKEFIAAGHQAGFTDLELRGWIKQLWAVESTAKLISWQVTVMTDALKRKTAEK